MDLNLKGKKALVMGSSAGLGKAIAESLINEGVDVIISSRTEANLIKVQEEIKAKGYVTADLTKAGEGRRLTEEAIKLLGGIDIIVTNTGGPQKANFMEVTDEQWMLDYQSIWMSVTESIKTAIPEMTKNNFGRFFLVTSIAAKEPLPGLTTSNGLRAGLEGLAKSISIEVAASGITINTILPGYTNTDRLKALNLSDEKVKAMVPAGRLGRPCELADLITFLSSEKGSYITGQSIAVDGGVLKGH